jgi:hypothetical protein
MLFFAPGRAKPLLAESPSRKKFDRLTGKAPNQKRRAAQNIKE